MSRKSSAWDKRRHSYGNPRICKPPPDPPPPPPPPEPPPEDDGAWRVDPPINDCGMMMPTSFTAEGDLFELDHGVDVPMSYFLDAWPIAGPNPTQNNVGFLIELESPDTPGDYILYVNWLYEDADPHQETAILRVT